MRLQSYLDSLYYQSPPHFNEILQKINNLKERL